MTPVVGVGLGQAVLAIQMQQRGAGIRTVVRAYRTAWEQALTIIMIDVVSSVLLVAVLSLGAAIAVLTSDGSVALGGLIDNAFTWVTIGLAVPWFAGSVFAVGVVDRLARQVYGYPAFASLVSKADPRPSTSFAGGPSPKSVRDQAVKAILKTTSLASVEALSHAALGEYPTIRRRLLDNADERLIFAVAAVEYCELAEVEAPQWVASDVLPALDEMSMAGVTELRSRGAEPFVVDVDQCCRLLMWMIKERHWEFVGRWMPIDPGGERRRDQPLRSASLPRDRST